MNDPKRILIIFLAFVVIVVGAFSVKGMAEDAGYKTQVRYTTAIQAEDADHFNYAVDSQQGNLLVNGIFRTEDKNLVKFPEMTKGFTYVEREKEHYTMHTREVCSGSGKRESCHTQTYYEWDSVGSEEQYASKFTFYDRQYNPDLFNLSEFKANQSCKGITKDNTDHGFFSEKHGCDRDEYYLSNNDRYVYEIAPQSFQATFLANSLDGGLKPVEESHITLQNKSIKQAMHDVGTYKVYAFWTTLIAVIVIFICACVAAYAWVMADGVWSLND